MKYIREKKTRFGQGFLDVDLYEMDDGQVTVLKKAKKKTAEVGCFRRVFFEVVCVKFAVGQDYFAKIAAG